MSKQGYKQPKAYEFFLVGVVFLIYSAGAHFLSFAGPLYLLWSFRGAPIHILLLLTVFVIVAIPLSFVAILVLTKRLLIRKVPLGNFSTGDWQTLPWVLAIRVMTVYMSSPLRGIINDHLMFSYPFYRGMGAKLYPDTFLAVGALLMEPWAVSLGRHTVVGHEACISGHILQDQEVWLGRVEVGDDVVIGARAFIWPDVKIGNGAKIAAYSVVTRGTVIPPGEVWGGIPARKLRGISEIQNSLSPDTRLIGSSQSTASAIGPVPLEF